MSQPLLRLLKQGDLIPIDPDQNITDQFACIDRLREIAEDVHEGDVVEIDTDVIWELSELMENLNHSLCNGGRLPKRWQKAAVARQAN